MTDCPNAEVRDQLPDLLHARLTGAARAGVEAHVATCAECREELALLSSMHAVLHAAPRVNVATIVAAVSAPRVRTHRKLVGWRVAAAVTVLVGGASSLVVMRNGGTQIADTAHMRNVAVVQAPVSVSAQTQVTATAATNGVKAAPTADSLPTPPAAAIAAPAHVAVPARVRELAMGGAAMADLNDRELSALLEAIDELDAVPSTEVESNSVSPLSPRRSIPR